MWIIFNNKLCLTVVSKYSLLKLIKKHVAKTCFLFAIYNERFFRLNAVAMLNEVIFYYDL